ncbi:MAG TPA: SprT family zinc-dependent metalloprotease [Steroidobacteraceae bacterium]|jgi:hypothetical protein
MHQRGAERMLRQLQLWDNDRSGTGWSVRESARARRLSVRVFRSGGVEIVVPPRTSARRVSEFVRAHRDWIDGQRRRAEPLIDWPLPPQTLVFSAIGERWRCTAQAGAGGVRVKELVGGELHISGRLHERERLRRPLVEWLVRRAHRAFEPQLRRLAVQMAVQPQRLQVRCQRARWGSCSRRSTISLNACLLFQRPEVLRYLMVHELSHLRHMNHSERFWTLVERFEPAWKPLDAELAQGWRRVPSWILR